jgi:hypothetical protein
MNHELSIEELGHLPLQKRRVRKTADSILAQWIRDAKKHNLRTAGFCNRLNLICRLA